MFAALITLEVETTVKDRYSEAARMPEASLCCPIDYDTTFLENIPKEVIERDYGCGDPSKHVRPGETVLDLGSGSGKICFIASQIVGAQGRVVGVDMNDEMLALTKGEDYRATTDVAAPSCSTENGKKGGCC